MKAIAEGLRQLMDFRGRTALASFWPYAVFAVAVTFIVGGLTLIPLMTESFAQTLAFAAANPDKATVVASPGHVSVQIHDATGAPLPDFNRMAPKLALVIGVAVLLSAAAVTRRLHDSGRSGWWGLPPLILLATGLSLFPGAMRAMMTIPDEGGGFDGFAPFFVMFGVNLLYLLSLAVLIILLVRPGVKGSNRFGPESA